MLEKINQNNGYPKKKDTTKMLKKIINKKTLSNQKEEFRPFYTNLATS